MNNPHRRTILSAGAAALTLPGLVAAEAAPLQVRITTNKGSILAELYPDKAPLTVANFMRYVRARRFDGSSFYRAVRTPGAEDTGLLQGGLQNNPAKLYPPIPLESTLTTGLKHVDGALSMARGAPSSATADFFICVGPAPSLDADPSRPGDNLGYAAFGRVFDGMDLVKAILAMPSNGPARNPMMKGQMLDPPAPIISIRTET